MQIAGCYNDLVNPNLTQSISITQNPTVLIGPKFTHEFISYIYQTKGICTTSSGLNGCLCIKGRVANVYPIIKYSKSLVPNKACIESVFGSKRNLGLVQIHV